MQKTPVNSIALAIRYWFSLLFICCAVLVLANNMLTADAAMTPTIPAGVPRLEYEIVARYPHDASAYTEGLWYDKGSYYESTGLYGQSRLQQVDLKTGKVLRSQTLNPDYYGEGLAYWQGRLYQLTWRENSALVYAADTLNKVEQFHYDGEGWGLTSTDTALMMSNGSAQLQFIDPNNFQPLRTLPVHAGQDRIANLNELEYHAGFVYANVWKTPFIIKINAKTGAVVGVLDLTPLVAEIAQPEPEGVLNGIAYRPETDTLLVTGKWWPVLFEIKE